MPSLRRLARQLANRRVPRRTRLGLVVAGTRRRLRPRTAYSVPYGPFVVHLSHSDFATDRASFDFVVAEEAYATDYRGTVVLDVGAHRGYFGAYALARGAQTVVSFEPERENLALLERSAAAARAAGADWRVRAVAVGPVEGEAELHVMSASWAMRSIRPKTSPSTRSGPSGSWSSPWPRYSETPGAPRATPAWS